MTDSPRIDCPHPSAKFAARVCEHLLPPVEEVDYYHAFTGRDLEYDLLCAACAQAAVASALRNVCAACLKDVYSRCCMEGMVGIPGVRVRASDLRFVYEDVLFPALRGRKVAAIDAVSGDLEPTCIALFTDGTLARLDIDSGILTEVAKILDDGVDFEQEVSLKVSADGRFAAIANAFGLTGLVIDLHSNCATMRWNRDKYFPEHCRFPLAFAEMAGHTLLVHGTGWNRLDVSDPATGVLLTARSPTSYRRGETRPEHYLDYFQGSLLVSPDGNWICSNGWVWHPVGIVRAWNLKTWVEYNVWESEDGPTMRLLCCRDYFWGHPICWLDGAMLAIYGFGSDDNWIVPAVRIFDAETGREWGAFAGPKGAMAFDKYLFSSNAETGTDVWDIATGERLHQDEHLNPALYHPTARCFVSLLPDGAIRVSRLVEGNNVP